MSQVLQHKKKETTTPEVNFKLDTEFLTQYEGKQPKWGPLGYVTYKRTYARDTGNGTTEEYWQTCKRVVEGVYTIQMRHCAQNQLPWKKKKAQLSAQTMFRLMWEFKFTPPGRGFWMMGTDYVYTRGGACLNNCAFVSTKGITEDFAEPFCFLMDTSMLGVGVGGDTKGAGTLTIQQPTQSEETYIVEDTREGWVDLIKTLINAYAGKNPLPKNVSYDKVRPFGEPIKGFGGVASGPEPLAELYNDIKTLLDKRIGETITSSDIVDIFNLIGRCVVAGNVRRTAEIMFGDPNDQEFMDLKNPEINKEALMHHRWASNNSIFGTVGMDYTDVAERTARNGEPGYEWLENAQQFSRMGDPADNKDARAMGGNPCVVGNTLIAVADGRNAVPIKDLVGTEYPVYSVENGRVVIKNSIRTWKTRENAEVWKLVLDDGSELIATPDHKVMLRDGTYKPLSDLKKGESVMPFNSYVSNERYRQISSNTGRDRRQYRMVAEHAGLIVDPKTTAIHHKNFNSFNDSVENLKAMSHEEHQKLHTERMRGENNPMKQRGTVVKMRESRGSLHGKNNPMFGRSHKQITLKKIGERSEQNWQNQHERMVRKIREGMQDPEVKKKLSVARMENTQYVEWACPVCQEEKILTAYEAETRKTCSHSCSNTMRSLEKAEMWNHKVKSVGFYGNEDVYDMTVEGTHNFGIVTSTRDDLAVTSSGLFVHNCLEQTLEPYELCCLVETYPSRHDSVEEWIETLKYAYLYAKSVTLVMTHNPRTNAVMTRNRRIGCSMSGIVQAFKKFGRRQLLNAASKGFERIRKWDKTYSEWFGIPRSIKMTSVKPSGTVSLLPGVTPGIHYPIAEYYIRNIRFQEGSPLLTILKAAGYTIEQDKYSPKTKVVSFPIKEAYFDRSVQDVSMWEQLENAAQIQQFWADNQVSVTISFSKKEAADIKYALELYEARLKGVSFLPKKDHGYEQAPYIPITKEQYEQMSAKVRPVTSMDGNTHEMSDKFCDGEACEIQPATK